MNILKNKLGFSVFTLLLSIAIPYNAYAMHIAEGYLPLNWSLFYFIIAAPFVFLSIKIIRTLTKSNKEVKMLLALLAAFVFMMSALKLPSVTGSSSHPTGVGIGAIIFGPIVMSAISLVVLLFQALLLAHGGLTTLGANLISMGIVGPLVSYGLYRALRKKNKTLAVGLGAATGNLATYIVASLQLAMAFPVAEGGVLQAFIKFVGIFAITQIPLAIVEGGISVIIYDFIQKHCKSELQDIGQEVL